MRRQLTPKERALWSQIAASVTPLRPARPGKAEPAPHAEMAESPSRPPQAAIRRMAPSPAPVVHCAPPPRPLGNQTLDSSWDRKLARGVASPDFTLDLHGCTLDAAHARLDHGLSLALAQGARIVLLITGRPRPQDNHASRSERRGAIRAKFLDWLAVGPHASRIAAIRPAHPRHGGAGAVYIVLRRER